MNYCLSYMPGLYLNFFSHISGHNMIILFSNLKNIIIYFKNILAKSKTSSNILNIMVNSYLNPIFQRHLPDDVIWKLMPQLILINQRSAFIPFVFTVLSNTYNAIRLLDRAVYICPGAIEYLVIDYKIINFYLKLSEITLPRQGDILLFQIGEITIAICKKKLRLKKVNIRH